MNESIPLSALYGQIKRIIQFPRAQVCKHLVAADLLSMIEENGNSVSEELAAAIVGADDEEALRLLANV